MKPFYETALGKLYNGDALSVLSGMESESVQCCVTSPPYWGLRDYGLPPMIWDDPGDCEHEWGDGSFKQFNPQRDASGGVGGGKIHGTRGEQGWTNGTSGPASQGQFCQLCGAWRGCLGLEPTPELYVKHMVEIFREVKRVLRDDGTLFLNLGDSYATHASKRSGQFGNEIKSGFDDVFTRKKPTANSIGLKEKDLCGIPWRVAFALQADGWYLRQDIIWHKPNPMPESVTDRCTKAHEYMFLMSKNRKYYYDAEAIKEDFADNRMGASGVNDGVPQKYASDSGRCGDEGLSKFSGTGKTGRNKRSVWTVTTKSFPEAHFATFPPKLIEPCILAGCQKGGIVLDPFMGAGTVALVCEKLNRKWLGIELSEEYCQIAEKRIYPESSQLKWC